MKELLMKIQNVADAIKGIEKDMTVGKGNYSYKAVSDTMVTLKVKEAEKENGIISIPIKQDLVSSEVLRIDKQKKNSSEVTESIQYVDVVKMTLRIYDLDNPEHYIDVDSFGRGLDSSDKGFGKASTYARKYALLNAYKIATGEDPDSEASKKETSISKDEKKIKVVDYLSKNNEYCLEVTAHFNLSSLDDLTDSHVSKIYTNLIKKGKL
jgi:hypothetical protein